MAFARYHHQTLNCETNNANNNIMTIIRVNNRQLTISVKTVKTAEFCHRFLLLAGSGDKNTKVVQTVSPAPSTHYVANWISILNYYTGIN